MISAGQLMLATLNPLYLLTGLYFTATGSTELKLEPTYVEAVTNETVRLNCTTSYKDGYVNWQHVIAGETESPNPIDIYLNNLLVNQSYKIEKDSTKGSFDLIIEKVNPGYSGQYTCIDRGGMGQNKMAEITVIGHISCTDLERKPIGHDSINVATTCNVTFVGNMHPEVEWRNSAGYVITDGVITTLHHNRVTSVLNANVSVMTLPSNYTFQTTVSKKSHPIEILPLVDPIEFTTTRETSSVAHSRGNLNCIELSLPRVLLSSIVLTYLCLHDQKIH